MADAEGRIRLPFVPELPGTWQLEAWGEGVGISRPVELRATTEQLELVLRQR